MGALALGLQHHATWTHGHEQVSCADGESALLEPSPVPGRARLRSARGDELSHVGLEDPRTRVRVEVAGLRIDDHWNASTSCADDERDQVRGENALVVVADDDRVGAARGSECLTGEGVRDDVVGRKRVVRLVVEASDLVAGGVDPGLRRRGTGRRREDAVRVHAAGDELRSELTAFRVAADERDELRLSAERGHIRGHIRGSARRRRLALEAYHGDRDLGRESIGRAPEVSVEHRVADDGDARGARPLQDGAHPVWGQHHTLLARRVGP